MPVSPLPSPLTAYTAHSVERLYPKPPILTAAGSDYVLRVGSLLRSQRVGTGVLNPAVDLEKGRDGRLLFRYQLHGC